MAMDKLVGMIIAIIFGFALIGSGWSALKSNATMGIGLIVAGIAAIAFGFKVLM